MSAALVHIGTLREKPLHASLKQWYFRPGDQVEATIGGFVIDLVREGLLIEVQTVGFSGLKRKVGALLAEGHRIRIVHPIPVDRWIVRIDDDGQVIGRRRSPRHGSPVDVFAELVSIADLVADPQLEIELVLTVEEEYRKPGRSWRRNGWTVVERRLIEVVDTLRLDRTEDLVGLLPAMLPETFTTAELAQLLERPLRAAQQMAYCLRRVGAIVVVGKRRNAVVYRRADQDRSDPHA